MLSDNTSEWAGVDFGGVRPVQTVAVYFVEAEEIEAPQTYQLEYWSNGGWQPLEGGRRTPAKPQANQANSIQLDAPVYTSKLRVVMKPQRGTAVAISELEAWGPPDGQDDHVEGNVVPAFSVSASYTSKFDRVEAIGDGIVDKAERWTAFESPNATDWVQLDLTQPEMICGVYLYFYNDNNGVVPPPTYEIQYADGNSWQPVVELRKRPEVPIPGLNQAHFEPVETQQIRIVTTHAGNGKYSGLYEVQLVKD